VELQKRLKMLGLAVAGGRYSSSATQTGRLQDLISRLRPWQSSRPLIRVGPASDGGYLLPDDLDGIAACISPGVSDQVGFDLDVAGRGIDVFMADASVDGPPQQHPRFHFDKRFLGPVTTGDYVTIDDFCAEVPGFSDGRDLLLQMDIEGAEYPVIQGMSPSLQRRFRIIVLELHGLNNLFHPFSFQYLSATFDKLLQTHRVVHLHPNNCCGSATMHGIEVPKVMEMTLLRADRAEFSRGGDAGYPHPLDADNVPSKPSLVLPPLWR
jgi:hypothetical protein